MVYPDQYASKEYGKTCQPDRMKHAVWPLDQLSKRNDRLSFASSEADTLIAHDHPHAAKSDTEKRLIQFRVLR
jgi:hypothetical protein